MSGKTKIGARFSPSSFDLSEPFTLRPITIGEKWDTLTAHIEKVRPRAVLGYCPPVLQLDARIYETVHAFRIPYISSPPHNDPLAIELIRQMRVDLIVATRVEALELEQAMSKRNISAPAWHIILAPHERGAALPGPSAFADVHEFPGMPYGY